MQTGLLWQGLSAENLGSAENIGKKNWEAVKSYVIQVEWAPDCYRHIRIGKQATLITLHTAILDAFDFDDDHCYVFYMNDRYRSKVDAYSSDALYMEGPSECDVTLGQLRLKRGINSNSSMILEMNGVFSARCCRNWMRIQIFRP